MRNLVVFLARNYFFLLFLLLEIVSLYFVVQHNYFQHASAVSASNAFTGSLYEWRSDMTDYLNLKEQNKQLAEKLAMYMTRDSSSLQSMQPEVRAVNDTFYRQRYEFLSAKVIDNTVSERNNYIILDRGSAHGVKVDMGVICPNGVVGIVREVSEHYCVVMSVLHEKSSISASVKRDGTFGQLKWEGPDYRTATLTGLETHSKIAKGDTLITSGLGDAFPEGVPVGTVLSYLKKPGEKYYTVEVGLTTDFKKIKHVFIVKNLMRDELQDLRKKTGIQNGQ